MNSRFLFCTLMEAASNIILKTELCSQWVSDDIQLYERFSVLRQAPHTLQLLFPWVMGSTGGGFDLKITIQSFAQTHLVAAELPVEKAEWTLFSAQLLCLQGPPDIAWAQSLGDTTCPSKGMGKSCTVVFYCTGSQD